MVEAVRVDLHAACVEHLRLAADECEASIVAEPPQVSGVEPAVAEGSRGRLRVAQVALRHSEAPVPDAPDRAERNRLVVLVDDLHLGARLHPADVEGVARIGRAARGRPRLRRAVVAHDQAPAGDLLQALLHTRRQDGS